MKILFLDVDGVLNSQEYFKKLYHIHGHSGMSATAIDDRCVEYLSVLHQNDVFDTIVVHSTWRLLSEHRTILEKKLKEHSMSIHAYTSGRDKKEALIDYIETLDKNDDYIILDDERVVGYPHLDDKTYLVDMLVGLTKKDVVNLVFKRKKNWLKGGNRK